MYALVSSGVGQVFSIMRRKKYEVIEHQCNKCSNKSSSRKYLNDHKILTKLRITFQCNQCEIAQSEISCLMGHTLLYMI